MAKRWVLVMALVGALLAGAACSPAGRQAGEGLSSTAVEEKRSGGARASMEDVARKGADAGRPAVQGSLANQPPRPETGQLPRPLPPSGVRVIKDATLELRVGKGDFEEAFARASALAERFGGFVTGSSTSEHRGRLARGTITLRVPSDRFQAAIEGLRGLGKLVREGQQGQDVSAEFVDLEARLRQAKAQEAFFLRLMDQARSIEDMIRIQEQLAGVQLRIEEIEGRLNYLRDQTGFSTITVHVFEEGIKPAGGLERAWQRAGEAFLAVVGGLVVGIGWVAPLALLGLAAFGAWKVLRRRGPRPRIGLGADEGNRTPA
jgi:hypothetical protein